MSSTEFESPVKKKRVLTATIPNSKKHSRAPSQEYTGGGIVRPTSGKKTGVNRGMNGSVNGGIRINSKGRESLAFRQSSPVQNKDGVPSFNRTTNFKIKLKKGENDIFSRNKIKGGER